MSWRLLALVLGALALLAGAVILAGQTPMETLTALYEGSLGSARAVSGTLKETTPLLILGLAVFVALRAGLFNIGVEGQFLLGALAGVAVAVRIPGVLGIVMAVTIGMAAGALWALPAGWIRAYRNGHEVITTIMLNNVAWLLSGWLLAGPLKDPGQQGRTTGYVQESAKLPDLLTVQSLQLNLAILLGLIMTFGLAWWLKRTVAGYELQAVGANSTAAKFAGISNAKVQVWAMVASGAIAGLAGVLQVLAYEWRVYEYFYFGYGFNALGVALLAGSSAFGLIPAALLFGILERGGARLAISGMPKGITFVVLAMLILVAAAVRFRKVKAVG